MEGAILSHLSGSTGKGDVHLAFHWVVPSGSTTATDETDYDQVEYEEVEPTDSKADLVEPTSPDNDQTDVYANPDDLVYANPDDLVYANPDDLVYVNPDDLYM